MTLDAAAQMRKSASLKGRIESAALAQGKSLQWVDRSIAALCATPEWLSVWAVAYGEAAADGDPGANLGIRQSVISDDMIETAVKALVDRDDEPTTLEPLAPLEELVALAATVADLKAQLAGLQAGTNAPATA